MNGLIRDYQQSEYLMERSASGWTLKYENFPHPTTGETMYAMTAMHREPGYPTIRSSFESDYATVRDQMAESIRRAEAER